MAKSQKVEAAHSIENVLQKVQITATIVLEMTPFQLQGNRTTRKSKKN